MNKLVLLDPTDDDVVVIDPARLVEVPGDFGATVGGSAYALANRTDGAFVGKAFYLSEEFDWELGEDGDGATCLVPLGRL